MGQDSSLGSDSLRAGRFGHRIPVGARFSAPIQTVLGPTHLPVKWVPGLFLGCKATGTCCSATEDLRLCITITATQPHTVRETGDTGVNHIRKQMAYEDEVHTVSAIEALTDKTGCERQYLQIQEYQKRDELE